jgi:hypothetical protein
MKAVDGFTYVVLRVGRWSLGPPNASPGQFGIIQINGSLRAALGSILA